MFWLGFWVPRHESASLSLPRATRTTPAAPASFPPMKRASKNEEGKEQRNSHHEPSSTDLCSTLYIQVGRSLLRQARPPRERCLWETASMTSSIVARIALVALCAISANARSPICSRARAVELSFHLVFVAPVFGFGAAGASPCECIASSRGRTTSALPPSIIKDQAHTHMVFFLLSIVKAAPISRVCRLSLPQVLSTYIHAPETASK